MSKILTSEYSNVKKGELLLITDGEYSDYSVHGLFRVKKDFNLEESREDFDKEFPTSDKYDFRKYGRFINYLSLKDLVDIVEYKECHLGDHGDFFNHPLEAK